MTKRLLTLLLTMVLAATGLSQGLWKLDYTTDDYTLEKTYVLSHRTNGVIDAVFFPKDNLLKILYYYSESAYFDTCWDAEMNNDGRISDSERKIFTRLILPNDYDERAITATITYFGTADDGKINTHGFISAFFIPYTADDLKKGNFVTFKYWDKITDDIRTVKLSLAGFTRCYAGMR